MENFDPVINFGCELDERLTVKHLYFPVVNKLFVEMNLDLITFYLAIQNDVKENNYLIKSIFPIFPVTKWSIASSDRA